MKDLIFIYWNIWSLLIKIFDLYLIVCFLFQCDVPEVDELDGIINEDESSDSEGFVQDGGGRKSSHNRIESRIPTVVSDVRIFSMPSLEQLSLSEFSGE